MDGDFPQRLIELGGIAADLDRNALDSACYMLSLLSLKRIKLPLPGDSVVGHGIVAFLRPYVKHHADGQQVEIAD